ncbi:hypothetical protein [uncultured Alistipes sp.]|jgi:hypothetical protein|uniref:hypothetical protein n=1 Tax=uncultured Alistipes sp. TaxID=538949 RepID=UPI0025FC580D|nr:hypothetical protein [uncultured Alistipes sp.]
MIHTYSKFVKEFNEDFKTYVTIGQLRYLPADLFWNLLRASSVSPKLLPATAGRLEAFEMWPSWDPTGTGNTKRVEPDVFIRFSRFDLIIEAKKSDSGGQEDVQWDRETKSYHNEYKNDKDMILLAIGGNCNLDCNTDDEYKHVHKATWMKLLHAVHDSCKQRSSLSYMAESTEQEIRILEAVEEAFAQYNEYVVDLLEMMPKQDMNIETPLNINEIWKIM